MISDGSGPTLTSTVEATVTESLNGTVVLCRDGGSSNSTIVGRVTVRVVGAPSVSSIEYSVESATTGRVRLTVSSNGVSGTNISYSASLIGGGGSVQVDGNIITVSGFSYTASHVLNVSATICPEAMTEVPVSFNITKNTLQRPTASIMCSNPSLPVRMSWTVDCEVQTTTDPNVPLVPPPTATPTISYSSTGGRSGSTSSDSPYLLTDTVRNDMYTFTVTVTNVAGVSSGRSSGVLITPLLTDQSTVLSSNCLTIHISENCLEDVSSGDFRIQLHYAFGTCRDLNVSDYSTSTTGLSAHSTCVPVGRGTGDFCYQATLLYGDIVIGTYTNLYNDTCSIEDLQSFSVVGVYHGYFISLPTTDCVDGSWSSAETISCSNCIDGSWSSAETISCSTDVWVVVVGTMIFLIASFVTGTLCGVLIGRFWSSSSEALSQKKLWVIVVVVLTPVFGIGLGLMIYYSFCWRCANSSKPKKPDGITESSSPPPPGPDSTYADPNTIEHQTTVTGQEYAMVDVNGKKKKLTQQAALYQDPTTIEHQTPPSGDTYAVVDKPKRGSSKKREPDVVPPGSEGLTYADIDVAASRHKSNPAPQLPSQDPGLVEYTVIGEKLTNDDINTATGPPPPTHIQANSTLPDTCPYSSAAH